MDSRVQHRQDQRSFLRFGMWVLVGALALMLLAVGAVTAQPLKCGLCHSQPAFLKATKAAPHAGIACGSCHVPRDVGGRATFAFRQVFGMVVPLVPVGDRIVSSVPNETCLGCHAKVMTTTSGSRGYRIAHKSCATGVACTDCHSSVGHGSHTPWARTSEMETCLACHKKRGATESCSACHDTKQESERIGVSAWKITHGPNWRKAHGAGDTDTCTTCHEREKCAKCHLIPLPHGDSFVQEHAKLASDQAIREKSCTVCHKQTFCDDCHGLTMPHSRSFTAGHPKQVEREGDKRCMRCHTSDDCSSCHVKHVHPVSLDQALTPKSSPGGER